MNTTLIIFDIIFLVFGIGFILSYLPFINYYYHGIRLNKYKKPLPDAKKFHKFAILIPARDESAVIEGLLKSIVNQNYPKDNYDIYIAVEDIKDKTCEIAKKYNAHIYVKQDFTRKGKGYILEELTNHIFNNFDDQNYDAFIIADADNILTDGFIAEMNKAYDCGYQIAVGKRNSKNWNDGWIASCTAITFVKFSRFQNFAKTLKGRVAMLAGTGFYIDYSIVKKTGWQWHSLTEDNELTIVSALNKYKSGYVDDAVFLDEQPTDFTTSFYQRQRWIKGFFDNSATYAKRCRKGMFDKNCDRAICAEYTLGALPLFCVALAVILPLIGGSIVAILAGINGYTNILIHALITALVPLALYFLVMYLDAYLVLTLDKKFINISPKNKLIAVLMHPVFSMLYIVVALSMIIQKVEWHPIKHKVNLEENSSICETESELQSIIVNNGVSATCSSDLDSEQYI